MSLSLVAVFIPMLLMGGLIGRLFREFAVTLSVSILVSLLISVTLTPMMCARILRASPQRQARSAGMLTRAFQAMRAFFCRRAAPRQKAPPSGAASRRRSVGAFFWRGYKQ